MVNVCWETTKINQGSSCDLFVNSFNNIKKRTNGKSTGGGCSSGGAGSHLCCRPQRSTLLLHIRRLLKKLLWHKGRFLSNTNVLIEKCWCLQVHFLAASVIIWSTQYNSTIPIRSEECVGYGWLSNKSINNLCSCNKKQSWKANGEHAQIYLTFWYISYVVSPQSTQWVKALAADFSTDKVPVMEILNQGKEEQWLNWKQKHDSDVYWISRIQHDYLFFFAIIVIISSCGCCCRRKRSVHLVTSIS